MLFMAPVVSCEIILSGLMKPTEKFVPIFMLMKNKKMFQRAVLVFRQDYPIDHKLWSCQDRATEGQNPMIYFEKFFLSV